MSGKDERPLRDYPICPKCGESFCYWVGRFDGNNMSVVYFNSLEHQRIHDLRPLRIYDSRVGRIRDGTKVEAETVEEIHCSGCGYVPPTSTRKEIIKMAVMFLERER